MPTDDTTRHSGMGRIGRVRMRPMSLYEMGHPAGEVSIRAMFDGEAAAAMVRPGMSLADVASFICLAIMAKTSVEIDREIAAQAASILGTTTLRDTIDASLREIVNARRRLELVALLSEPGRHDSEAIDDAWGGPA